MVYKMIEITPEEYVALGTAGVWVFGSDTDSVELNKFLCKLDVYGDGHDRDRLAAYARPNVFPGRAHYFKHYYTRVELADNHPEGE